MSSKLWVVRVCVALAVLLLFIGSSYAYWWWQLMWVYTFSRHWELLGLSVLLQIMAGVLLGIPPEVFLNLRKVRFSPIKFIVLAIIPIVALILIVGYWQNWFPHSLPGYVSPYVITEFGLITSSVWIGVAIGKAFDIRQ